MLWIKTIDFRDGGSRGNLVDMDSDLYALETMVRERLTHARDEARRQNLTARARASRPGLRVRLGDRLIALGAWLRDAPTLVATGQP
jgi:hypothetical protein